MTPESQRAREVSLVLGAGGARGLAHIGVLEVLEARGYRVGAIAGSSMGALVGGFFAAGKLGEYRDWACTLERSGVLRLLDFAFGFPGLIKGDRLIGALRELVGDHLIEELPIPYTAVATDLAAQREVWLSRGSLFDAIRASIAIPMLFTPHRVNGRDLVDGGLLAPVPIAVTRSTRADLVIAVDVNAPVRAPRPPVRRATEIEPVVPPEGYRARIAGFIDGITGAFGQDDSDKPVEPPKPGFIDLMSRSLETMQGQMSRMHLAIDPPEVLVRVNRDACLFYEFWRATEMIARGRDAAEAALDALEQYDAPPPEDAQPPHR